MAKKRCKVTVKEERTFESGLFEATDEVDALSQYNLPNNMKKLPKPNKKITINVECR